MHRLYANIAFCALYRKNVATFTCCLQRLQKTYWPAVCCLFELKNLEAYYRLSRKDYKRWGPYLQYAVSKHSWLLSTNTTKSKVTPALCTQRLHAQHEWSIVSIDYKNTMNQLLTVFIDYIKLHTVDASCLHRQQNYQKSAFCCYQKIIDSCLLGLQIVKYCITKLQRHRVCMG